MTNNILIGIFLLISVCSSCQPTDGDTGLQSNVDAKKILIVYLTRTNNTRAIAHMIHEQTGGKLVALEPVTPYPEDYKAIVDQVAKENESGFLPPLKTKIENIQEYDVIFVGFPTWGMKLPPPMKSFLTKYNISGKTVVPFNTNAGYGLGSSLEMLKELCPQSKILEAFSMKGGIERDGILFVMKGDKETEARKEVMKWLREIKMIK
jgi:flavodoxin